MMTVIVDTNVAVVASNRVEFICEDDIQRLQRM
jgi:hypothetical protein